MKMFKKFRLFVLPLLLVIGSTAYSDANANLVRPKRHIGSFFKHLIPIVENPLISEPVSDSVSTIMPDAPTEVPQNSESVDATTNIPTANANITTTPAPAKESTGPSSPGTGTDANKESESDSAVTTPTPSQDKSSDDKSTATDIPNVTGPILDPSSPVPEVMPSSSSVAPTDPEGSTSTPPAGEDPDSSPSSQDPMDESSTLPGVEPSSTNPESKPENDENLTATTPSPDQTTKTNARKSKNLELETPETTTESVSTDNGQPTTIPDMCSTVRPRSGKSLDTNDPKPEDESTEKSTESATATTTTLASNPSSSETPETGTTEQPEENLESIAKLLDKLNDQKKALADQIDESKKALDSVTSILNNDRDRRLNDVINQAQEEDVKPLAKELNENTTDYDKYLDPTTIPDANHTQRAAAKQFINERVSIPKHFQLLRSYLCLKTADPNVTFDQKVQLVGLLSETHVDSIRYRQHQLRSPLESLIATLTCTIKSTNPGNIPNDWQPNNYLNRRTMDQIRGCNQQDNFYSTNPFGRFTIIFRRIQDNFQDGLGSFKNTQMRFTQQVGNANKELDKLRDQCLRQQQLQMESEHLSKPATSYLPAEPAANYWNQQIPVVTAPAPQQFQWVRGQWRPSQGPGFQQWS